MAFLMQTVLALWGGMVRWRLCKVNVTGKCKHLAALLLHYREVQGFVSPPSPTKPVIKTTTVVVPGTSATEDGTPAKKLNFTAVGAGVDAQPKSVPPPKRQGTALPSKTPGFSLETGWKEMNVKTPKKRKAPNQAKALPRGLPSEKNARQPNTNLSEVQELKWQIQALRQKLAAKSVQELAQKIPDVPKPHLNRQSSKEHRPLQQQQVEKEQDESLQTMQQKHYEQIPLLLSGRELKDKHQKKESDSRLAPLKRKRTVLDKNTFRPTKKHKASAVDPAALFSQHNKDVDSDMDQAEADSHKNENAPSAIDAVESYTSEQKNKRVVRSSEKTPQSKPKPNAIIDSGASSNNKHAEAPVPTTTLTAGGPQVTKVKPAGLIQNKIPRTKPFFNIKNFLDLEASVEGKETRRGERDEHTNDDEYDDDDDDWIEKDGLVERSPVAKKVRVTEPENVVTVQPSADIEDTTPVPVVTEEALTKQQSVEDTPNVDISMMSTQEFTAFLNGPAKSVIPTPTTAAQTPQNGVQRTNSFSDLFAKPPVNSAEVVEEFQVPGLTASQLDWLLLSDTNKQSSSSTTAKNDPGHNTLVEVPDISLSQLNLPVDVGGGSQADWTLDQLRSLMLETGLSFAMTQSQAC